MDTRAIKEPSPENAPVEKKKNRVMLLLVVLIVAGVLATAGWFQHGSELLSWFKDRAGSEEELCHFIPIKEFQVNLADQGGRRYLRLKLYFGSHDKALIKEVNRREPEIRSVIISILRCTTVADLEGQEGMERLKTEILEQVNSLLSNGKLEEVYFDNFLIQ